MPPTAADVLHSGREWSDRDVRREAARYALAADDGSEPVTDWIIDDGLPEAGHAPVGVQRQYFGHNRQDRQLPGGGQLDHATPRSTCRWTSRCTCPRAGPRIHRGGPRPTSRRGDGSRPSPSWGRDDRACMRTGCRLGWCWPTARMATTPSFAGALRCEGLGYAVGLHRRPRCGAWICWDAESVTRGGR